MREIQIGDVKVCLSQIVYGKLRRQHVGSPLRLPIRCDES